MNDRNGGVFYPEIIRDGVETTTDNLTGRGGLALFVKYLNGVGIYALMEESFGKMRKSLKGQAIWNIFKRVRQRRIALQKVRSQY